MGNVSAALSQAWQCHQAGQLEEAERRYREILKAAPTRSDVWYLLGIACQMREKLPDAVASYKEALRLKPAYAEVLNNLGVAYRGRGSSARPFLVFVKPCA